MPSLALQSWEGERSEQLDEIESSHHAVGGSGRGRRFTTLQINQSYAVMVASQFQGFCRDLHDECTDAVAQTVAPTGLQPAVKNLLLANRQLDRGNPSPGALGSDFDRFGLTFWDLAQSRDMRVQAWQMKLDMLIQWRNAIAHQDFNPAKLSGIRTLTLRTVREWRRSCQGLAGVFDRVMYDYLLGLTGSAPWKRVALW